MYLFIVDGGYSEWSKFGACSKTCGKGFKLRSRTCDNPSPLHGGKSCVGPNVDTNSCKIKECPGKKTLHS